MSTLTVVSADIVVRKSRLAVLTETRTDISNVSTSNLAEGALAGQDLLAGLMAFVVRETSFSTGSFEYRFSGDFGDGIRNSINISQPGPGLRSVRLIKEEFSEPVQGAMRLILRDDSNTIVAEMGTGPTTIGFTDDWFPNIQLNVGAGGDPDDNPLAAIQFNLTGSGHCSIKIPFTVVA